jgi:hypothetical protein
VRTTGSKIVGRNVSKRRASLVRCSTERCLGEPSRSWRGEGQGQCTCSGTCTGAPRGSGDGTRSQFSTEQERPYPVAYVGQSRPYKRRHVKSVGAGRESEGVIVPLMVGETRTEGRAPTLVASEISGKREGMSTHSMWSNHPSAAVLNSHRVQARKPQLRLWVRAKPRSPWHLNANTLLGSTPHGPRWVDEPNVLREQLFRLHWDLCVCRHSKTIGKPCVGKPQARFERGLCPSLGH